MVQSAVKVSTAIARSAAFAISLIADAAMILVPVYGLVFLDGSARVASGVVLVISLAFILNAQRTQRSRKRDAESGADSPEGPYSTAE